MAALRKLARWMDPTTGTFLSVDPVVATAGDPQSYNGYAYARNNPVSFVDPSGRSIEEIVIRGAPWDGVDAGLFSSFYQSIIDLVAGQFIAGQGHVIFAQSSVDV